MFRVASIATLIAACVFAIAAGAWWFASGEPTVASNTVTPGYRIESGYRYGYTMEVPLGWETLRSQAQEGARAGKAGDDFVADIAVAKEETNEPSLQVVKAQVNTFLQATDTTPAQERQVQAGGFEGWMWELPEQPEENPRPRRDPYRLVVLYDPRGFQWILTFSWSSPEALKTYESVFEHALKTFRAK